MIIATIAIIYRHYIVYIYDKIHFLFMVVHEYRDTAGVANTVSLFKVVKKH